MPTWASAPGTHNAPAKASDTQPPDSVRDVISSPDQALDSDIQQPIEERMGDSLGDVRIHTGPQAASACEEINARAFTVGNHVAFNRGEYEPRSRNSSKNTSSPARPSSTHPYLK
ncbi:transposase [Natrinema thermotolerans DSM 11552]|nr:transposase [Natrinema thermotolerans DSM 11552]